MSRTLTATDRSALIRLASTLPEGSAERRAILAGLVAGTAPTNVLQALVRSSTEDLGDARRRYDLLEEEYERVGMGGVRLLLDQWHIHGQDRMAVMYHYMDPLTRRAGLSKSAFLKTYQEADFIPAAYRAAELYPGDPTKVFAIIAEALKVKPNGSFDAVDLGDILTTYNFHRERATIESLIQTASPIPYRQVVGRSPFITPRGFPKDPVANARWRYDNANQTLPQRQVQKALAEFIGMKPGQMILTNDLVRYIMEYVGVTANGLRHFGLFGLGPVVMHRDLIR